jgi:hypothetical protein
MQREGSRTDELLDLNRGEIRVTEYLIQMPGRHPLQTTLAAAARAHEQFPERYEELTGLNSLYTVEPSSFVPQTSLKQGVRAITDEQEIAVFSGRTIYVLKLLWCHDCVRICIRSAMLCWRWGGQQRNTNSLKRSIRSYRQLPVYLQQLDGKFG